MPNIKVVGPAVRADSLTNEQTDGRYEVHYLLALEAMRWII